MISFFIFSLLFYQNKEANNRLLFIYIITSYTYSVNTCLLYTSWNAIARATAGASGAELANIINEGALRAVRLGHTVVTQEDLEESVETGIGGAQRKNAVISPEEKKIIAYHEIGHALVAAGQSSSCLLYTSLSGMELRPHASPKR